MNMEDSNEKIWYGKVYWETKGCCWKY
jgi:hypothetical protein